MQLWLEKLCLTPSKQLLNSINFRHVQDVPVYVISNPDILLIWKVDKNKVLLTFAVDFDNLLYFCLCYNPPSLLLLVTVTGRKKYSKYTSICTGYTYWNLFSMVIVGYHDLYCVPFRPLWGGWQKERFCFDSANNKNYQYALFTLNICFYFWRNFFNFLTFLIGKGM